MELGGILPSGPLREDVYKRQVHAHALDLRQVEADGGKKGTHAFLNVAA